ncbi:hypothetical protein AK88_00008 [Plasmodium fragile]|uniref:Partial AB-hydrolase lipase domain-containing protein n=1 Tax=Plasmodium fragile TaxID=5857 RepID=A0A0D9QSX4_PLAFR|nr:uncharacterized protein AK88_00008 [Plasmodium fragile]KJP90160.1 hypothetical protein AK88_00008 [Plasmodium fragile]
MSGYTPSNVSFGQGSTWPEWNEILANYAPTNLTDRNANENHNNKNNVDDGDDECDNSSSSPPMSDTHSSANQSNNKHVAQEELMLECIPYKIGKSKKKKKNNWDTMEQLLFKLTNGKFKAQKHYVYTADGYRLNLYRIVSTNKDDNFSKKKGVFCLNHGLFESSITYTCKGYESLAFNIFANDYDVWISNNRGNAFTKFVGKNYALKKLRERYSLQDLKDIGVDVSEEMAAQGSSCATRDDEKKCITNGSTNDEDSFPEEGRKNTNLRKAERKDDNTVNNNGKNNPEGDKKSQEECNGKKDNLAYGIEDSPTPPGMLGDTSNCDSNVVSNVASNVAHVPKELENGEATKGEGEDEVEELINLNKQSEDQYDSDDDDDLIEVNEPDMENWTFDDMATKDLPAIIKYIKSKTQKEKIVYVGFSQGSIQLLISCCLNDFVNSSIARTYLLSLPIVLKKKDDMMKSVQLFVASSRWLKQIFASKEFLQKMLPETICTSLLFTAADLFTHNFFKFYTDDLDDNYKHIYFRYTPSGSTSPANVKKWCDAMNDGPISEAIDKYAYKCSFPITVVYGIKDSLVDTEGSIQYLKKIFTKNNLKIITHPEWSHIDPVLTDNGNIVLSCILEDMKREEEGKKQG